MFLMGVGVISNRLSELRLSSEHYAKKIQLIFLWSFKFEPETVGWDVICLPPPPTFFKAQSELIKPVSPGQPSWVHFLITFTSFHVDAPPRGTWFRTLCDLSWWKFIRKIEEETSLVPGGIRIPNLMITRRVLYSCLQLQTSACIRCILSLFAKVHSLGVVGH